MNSTRPDPVIAIAGNIRTSEHSEGAAEELGKALAGAGFRIMVYASNPEYLESAVVRGFASSPAAKERSIEVRYPLRGAKPQFPEQARSDRLFDWKPDPRDDWEMSFYQSLNEADGVLLMGGGDSTMIAGIIAMGRHLAILALPGFGGKAERVWGTLLPGRDLPSAEDISLMARPDWRADSATQCVESLRRQMQRRADEARILRIEQMRSETSIGWHAGMALLLFAAAVGCVAIARTQSFGLTGMIWLLFFSPLLAGVSGSTIRLVFDFRQGAVPLSRQSALTTAALGTIAGGIAGLLFLSAQLTALPQDVALTQAAALISHVVPIGFIAGFTMDAVFRKLVTADVADLGAVTPKNRQ